MLILSLSLSFPPKSPNDVVKCLKKSLDAVLGWMKENKRKFDPEKGEVLRVKMFTELRSAVNLVLLFSL